MLCSFILIPCDHSQHQIFLMHIAGCDDTTDMDAGQGKSKCPPGFHGSLVRMGMFPNVRMTVGPSYGYRVGLIYKASGAFAPAP